MQDYPKFIFKEWLRNASLYSLMTSRSAIYDMFRECDTSKHSMLRSCIFSLDHCIEYKKRYTSFIEEKEALRPSDPDLIHHCRRLDDKEWDLHDFFNKCVEYSRAASPLLVSDSEIRLGVPVCSNDDISSTITSIERYASGPLKGRVKALTCGVKRFPRVGGGVWIRLRGKKGEKFAIGKFLY